MLEERCTLGEGCTPGRDTPEKGCVPGEGCMLGKEWQRDAYWGRDACQKEHMPGEGHVLEGCCLPAPDFQEREGLLSYNVA
jgi:hypothetical protein